MSPLSALLPHHRRQWDWWVLHSPL